MWEDWSEVGKVRVASGALPQNGGGQGFADFLTGQHFTPFHFKYFSWYPAYLKMKKNVGELGVSHPMGPLTGEFAFRPVLSRSMHVGKGTLWRSVCVGGIGSRGDRRICIASPPPSSKPKKVPLLRDFLYEINSPSRFAARLRGQKTSCRSLCHV